MPLFLYKARNSKGEIIEETIQAVNKADAVIALKAEGFQVYTIKNFETSLTSVGGKVSVAEKSTFCRFTATMLKAGLSIHEAAEIIKQETENKKMKKILADIAFQTQKGKSLSMALSTYKDVFDPVFLTMIKAGEESGTLEQSFDYLAKELTANYEFSQKIKASLMYPLVVIIAMFAVGMLMLFFVLPKISVVFLKMNIKIPAITRIILQFGQFIGEHIFLGISVTIGILILLFLIGLMKSTRERIMLIFTKIPALAKMMNQIDVARFARTLAILLKSGVPIINSLEVASDSINQPKLRTQAKKFVLGVAKGSSLSEVLSGEQTQFPMIMIQTIKTGERTGSLEKVLEDLAQFYESEVEYQLKRVTALIEPVLMLAIGVIVGAMVIMIIAPIYSIIGGLQETIKP